MFAQSTSNNDPISSVTAGTVLWRRPARHKCGDTPQCSLLFGQTGNVCSALSIGDGRRHQLAEGREAELCVLAKRTFTILALPRR